ncbi:hypothetical protein BSKO_10732 [Bryopsis sp. KO-2023]|nr:hypothetical protein BSKO_10732 [Bryopsis sp. KO-2023]
MFKKLQRQIERKRDGKIPLKFRFDVRVVGVSDLPVTVDKCRVVWARGPKVQMTRVRGAKDGAAQFDEVLSQVATMYRATTHFEPKDYSFKVQAPSKNSGPDLMVTIGRATVNLAEFASLEPKTFEVRAPVKFKFGSMKMTAGMDLVVNSTLVKGLSQGDSMTEVSGLSGFTAVTEVSEQDLAGFDPESAAAKSIAEPASCPPVQPSTSVSDTIMEGPEIVELNEEIRALASEKKDLIRIQKKLESTLDSVEAEKERLATSNRKLLREKKSWDADKEELSHARLELEQELTLRASAEEGWKKEVETLKARVSEVQKEGDKQKAKYSKELANLRKMSMAALEEAEGKIRDAEKKLEKERKEHQDRVNLLEEDTSQLSQQLFYEKNALDAERRKFVMAEQNWRQVRQTMELELAEAKASLSGFDTDSQIEFSVDIYNGSMDLTDPPQTQMHLSGGDFTGYSLTPRSHDDSLSSFEFSKGESDEIQLRSRLSEYKAKVRSLRGSLRGSLQSVDFAEQSCREAAEKLHAMEAERNELKGQLVIANGRLNNLDQRHRQEARQFHIGQGSVGELESENRHHQEVVMSVESDLEVLRVESDRAAMEKKIIMAQLSETDFSRKDEMVKSIDTLRRDNSKLGSRLCGMESKLEQTQVKLETTVIRLEEAKGKLLGAQEDKLDLLQRLEEEVRLKERYGEKMEEAVAERKRISQWNAKLEEKVSNFRGELNKLATVLTEELELAKRKLRECQNAFDKMKVDRDSMEQLLAKQGRKTKKLSTGNFQRAVEEVRNNFSSKERVPEVTNSFFAGLEAELKLEMVDDDLENTEAVEKLKIQVDELQGINSSLTAEKNALLAEIDAIRACMMQVKEDCSKLKHENKRLEAERTSASRPCGGLADIQTSNMETRMHEASLHALETANSELKLALEDSESDCELLQKKLTKTESDLAIVEKRLGFYVGIEQQLALAQEANQRLETDLEAAEEAGRKLKEVTAELKFASREGAKVPELEGELATVWDAAQKLEAEVVELRGKVAGLEEERDHQWDAQLGHVARVPELEALVESLQKANLGLERSIARKKKDIESLQGEINGLHLHLQHSEEQESTKGNAIGAPCVDETAVSLQMEFDKMKSDLAQLTQLRDVMSKEKYSLEEALRSEASLRKQTEERLDREGVLRTQLESDLADHALKLAYADKSISQLTSELHEATEKLKTESKNTTGTATESDEIMQELVMAKIRMAELQETNTIMRCDLYRSKEHNMKLASKMTKLETLLYRNRSPRSK